jgi:hypothetical protein
MATFEPNKEILACYAALERKEKGCIKRTQSLLEYLSTQEKARWIASTRRLKRDMAAVKKVMPRKDW